MANQLDADLTVFEPYLEKMSPTPHQVQLVTLLNWVHTTFPQLQPRLAWSQPIFTDHGTFIVGFSTAKNHLNIALEAATLNTFREAINAAGDTTTKMLWQVRFDTPFNNQLLADAIQYNIDTKQATTTFWRS